MRSLAFVVIAVALAAPAAAQPAPRFTVGVSGGYQPTTTEFGDSYTFDLDREIARTRVTYPIDAGVVIDAGGAVRLWRGFGVGVAGTWFTFDGAAPTTTTLPHPLFLQQDREVSGDATALARKETAVHVQAQYALPPVAGLELVLMGGPSFLRVTQGMVADVRYSEEYPYDSVSFTGVQAREASGSAKGFSAGVDARWMFSRTVGAGVLLRFTRATIDLTAPQNRTLAVDAGGTQIGAGLRIAF